MVKPLTSKSCRTSSGMSWARADFLDQPPRRHDAHTLGAHDGDVVAGGDPRRLQQRTEAFLLDEQDGAEAVPRSDRGELGAEPELRLAVRRGGGGYLREIAAHLQGPERHAASGVRLDVVSSGVKCHVPGEVILGDVVGEQGLREIVVLPAACRSSPASDRGWHRRSAGRPPDSGCCPRPWPRPRRASGRRLPSC